MGVGGGVRGLDEGILFDEFCCMVLWCVLLRVWLGVLGLLLFWNFVLMS